jgi:pSer/pThr/pTyr-binding forkhead associated (FHA) protein
VELQGTATLGRATDNDIVLDEPTVSRCHALLFRYLEQVMLLDLESTNGTFVNGRQALPDAPVRLMDGDVITIGPVVVRYHASPTVHPANGCGVPHVGQMQR